MKKVKRNRISVKAEKIASIIRKEIVNGERKPGSMLPTREQLLSDLKVSSATLQKSVDQLISEGFIETNGSNGSFVTEAPPNIYQIGFVMYERSKNLLVYQSILESIRKIEKETPYRFKMYSFLPEYKKQFEIDQLSNDVKHGCLAGVISFHITPSELADYKIFDYTEIPILLLVASSLKFQIHKVPNVIKYSFDYISLMDGAVKLLHQDDIKDVAWIVHEDFSSRNMKYLFKICKEFGLNSFPHWIQAGTLAEYECPWMEYTTQLLMFGDKKPEAIVVLDENLMEQVMNGLSKTDIKIPEELKIIAHSSFPPASEKYREFNKIGFDIYEFLKNGIKVLNDWKKSSGYSEHSIKCVEASETCLK